MYALASSVSQDTCSSEVGVGLSICKRAQARIAHRAITQQGQPKQGALNFELRIFFGEDGIVQALNQTCVVSTTDADLIAFGHVYNVGAQERHVLEPTKTVYFTGAVLLWVTKP